MRQLIFFYLGFYESSESQSPKGRYCSTEPAETVSSWAYANDRPKSVGKKN